MSSVTYLNIVFVVFVSTCCRVSTTGSDGCDPIPTPLTAKKTGQKAWDKCIEYQERYVYPCEESSVPEASPQRGDYCKHDSLVQNDTDSAENEFNYVVTFAYNDTGNIIWLAGGTIISERHILTVAYIASTWYGEPHSVYLGAPVAIDLIDHSRLYKIKRIIPYPEYHKRTAHYHIAIVETEEPMKLNKYIKPACLHTGEPINYDEATLLARDFLKNVPNTHVTKVKLTRMSDEVCYKKLPRPMRLDHADKWLMCYRDKNYANQKLKHDSGCPLHVKSDKINCMNIVIGVSSLAISSRISWTFYTRVSPYLAWIESVVWP